MRAFRDLPSAAEAIIGHQWWQLVTIGTYQYHILRCSVAVGTDWYQWSPVLVWPPVLVADGRSPNTCIIWATTWQNQQNGCAPSEDSDQPGHPPSLIRVFAVRMKKAWVLSYPLSAQRRLWSDWADAQADLSLRWAHTHFVGFVMSWLICLSQIPSGTPTGRISLPSVGCTGSTCTRNYSILLVWSAPTGAVPG